MQIRRKSPTWSEPKDRSRLMTPILSINGSALPRSRLPDDNGSATAHVIGRYRTAPSACQPHRCVVYEQRPGSRPRRSMPGSSPHRTPRRLRRGLLGRVPSGNGPWLRATLPDEPPVLSCLPKGPPGCPGRGDGANETLSGCGGPTTASVASHRVPGLACGISAWEMRGMNG